MAHRENQSCIEACVVCAQTCEHCSSQDIVENRAACAKLCIDCADICWTASGYMSRGSRFTDSLCGLCAEICLACSIECAKHKNEHCQSCAAACRRCAEECQKMATASR